MVLLLLDGRVCSQAFDHIYVDSGGIWCADCPNYTKCRQASDRIAGCRTESNPSLNVVLCFALPVHVAAVFGVVLDTGRSLSAVRQAKPAVRGHQVVSRGSAGNFGYVCSMLGRSAESCAPTLWLENANNREASPKTRRTITLTHTRHHPPRPSFLFFPCVLL